MKGEWIGEGGGGGVSYDTVPRTCAHTHTHTHTMSIPIRGRSAVLFPSDGVSRWRTNGVEWFTLFYRIGMHVLHLISLTAIISIPLSPCSPIPTTHRQTHRFSEIFFQLSTFHHTSKSLMLLDLFRSQVFSPFAGDEDEVGDVEHVSVILTHSLLATHNQTREG